MNPSVQKQRPGPNQYYDLPRIRALDLRIIRSMIAERLKLKSLETRKTVNF